MLKALLLAAALAFAGQAGAQLAVGQPAPAFDTRLLDGKTLPAAATKGRVLLVVFWATWCPVCQRELPELHSLYEKHRGRGLEILALSVDADAFTVVEFWKDHEYAFPVAMATPAHGRIFGPVRGTPTFYLIDRQGVLRMARVGAMGMAQLEARLLPLF